MKISQLQREYQILEDSFQNCAQQQSDLNQQDLDSLRQLQKAEVQLNYLKSELADTNSLCHELKA